MEFRIADSFTDSLGRLTGEEQKLAKTTAFDLQVNPANPGMSFHKLDKARDRNFWSVRAGDDLRLIVHRTRESMMLCYVGHHDKAYEWAERRKIEVHPKTGAAQLVEIRELVQEVVVPAARPMARPASKEPGPFARTPDEQLLEYGVPAEWLADVHEATVDSLLSLVDHLPAEAAEALLELATGGKPRKPQVDTRTLDPYAHPDAQRRFRVMADIEELQRSLEAPWDRGVVFLHPEQRQWVERDYSGPARVAQRVDRSPPRCFRPWPVMSGWRVARTGRSCNSGASFPGRSPVTARHEGQRVMPGWLPFALFCLHRASTEERAGLKLKAETRFLT